MINVGEMAAVFSNLAFYQIIAQSCNIKLKVQTTE